jgi:indole-3-pyruvate monooxygenase
MIRSPPSKTEVVVVGAGPAGLASAACLKRAEIPFLLLERENRVAPAWGRHYDRLHLHTSRGFSGLPYLPMPRGYPRYPARDQVIEYFESYAQRLGLAPMLGVEVTDVRKDGTVWSVTTSEGVVECRAVVIATGNNGTPVVPTWPGIETFPGPMVHSSEYKNGSPYENQRVLVVGFGNSGGEIALDLLEHGAHPSVSVRSPVNVIPRDLFGVPILAIATPLAKLPPKIADLVTWPILKVYYPSYRRLGLRKKDQGPFRQIAESGHIPLLDIGTIRQIRRGNIRVERGISSIAGKTVHFEDRHAEEFDAIILATGYRPALPPGIPSPDHADADGLFLCGFEVSASGVLRKIGNEAKAIVAEIYASPIGSTR